MPSPTAKTLNLEWWRGNMSRYYCPVIRPPTQRPCLSKFKGSCPLDAQGTSGDNDQPQRVLIVCYDVYRYCYWAVRSAFNELHPAMLVIFHTLWIDVAYLAQRKYVPITISTRSTIFVPSDRLTWKMTQAREKNSSRCVFGWIKQSVISPVLPCSRPLCCCESTSLHF